MHSSSRARLGYKDLPAGVARKPGNRTFGGEQTCCTDSDALSWLILPADCCCKMALQLWSTGSTRPANGLFGRGACSR